MVATVTQRRKAGRPAGAKRTVGFRIQLTLEELQLINSACEIEGLGPSLLARTATLSRARRVLAEAGENA